MVTEHTKRDGKQKKLHPREVLVLSQEVVLQVTDQVPAAKLLKLKPDLKLDKELKVQATLPTTWASVADLNNKHNKRQEELKMLTPHQCLTLNNNFWNFSDPN